MDESLRAIVEDENLESVPLRTGRRRLSLHDQIVAALRARIVDGRIPPATRIPETALCEELDVSRTPLREALKVLAAEGLVELLPNRGAVTTSVTVEETQNLFEVIRSLESLVGELAAKNIDEESVEMLEAMHSRLTSFHKRGRRADYFRLNQQIHKQLAAASGNAELVQIYSGLSDKVMRARSLANLWTARWDASMKEHERIMELLRQRDGKALGEELSRHAGRTGDAVISALREVG